MRILIASVVVALAAAGAGVAQAAPPGEPEGFICGAAPVDAPAPRTCSYIATVEGLYQNSGSWTLTIKRGCRPDGRKCKEIITIDNPTTPGGFAYGESGVIQPGDRVTGLLKTNGTQMTVGNALGM